MIRLKQAMKSLTGLCRSLLDDKSLRLIIGLSFLAFLFKLYLLGQRSLYLDPDEGYYLLLARNLVEGNGYSFNGLPNIIFPPFLPLAISSIYVFIRNLQLSLNLITALSGTLLGLIVYLIARRTLSLLASLGCFLLTLFVYQLNSFVPIAARYTDVLYRGSDIVNSFLVIMSLYLAILLLEKKDYLNSALAGFFLSLAYLTRPEGFLLFAGLVTLLTGLRMISRNPLPFKKIICLMLIFALFSFPYIFYLRKTTGKWILSGKISASQKYREALLEVIKKEDWTSFNKIHYSLNQASTEMNDHYFGFHSQSNFEQNLKPEPFIKRVKANLALIGIIPRTLLPIPFMPFFLLGFVMAIVRLIKNQSFSDSILLLLLPYSLLIEVLSYPIPRHHLFLVPVFIIYAVEGASHLTALLSPKNALTRKKILFLVLSVWLIFVGYDYIMKLSRNLLNIPVFKMAREVEISISRSLQERGAQTIMSSHPSFAVRASSDWQVLPFAPLCQVLRFGKLKKVDYIIIPEGENFLYNVIVMKDSFIPQSNEDQFELEVLEKNAFYQWVRVIEKSQNIAKEGGN